ncbi:MAG: glycosyltransferase [Alphaproteobacteria bacterium]
MIPTWNPNRQFLVETLQSIMSAGIAADDMQIALVDDASTEFDPVSFLRDLGYDRVEIHRTEERRGIGANWNRCIALARGRWVHILHQDDRVRPDFYRALRRGIAGDSSVGAAFCQHAFIDETGRLIREGHMPPRAAGILHDWLQHIFINLTVQCPAIVVRRDVLERLGGFDRRYVYCLDWDMWQRIALAYPIWYEPSPLAEQRLHPRSQSSVLRSTPLKWKEIAAVIRRMNERLDPADAAWARPRVRRTYLRLARAYVRQAIGERFWRCALLEALGCLRVVLPSDIWAVARRQHPAHLKYTCAGTPPADSPARILLATEFIPVDFDTSTFGAFQRLRILLEAAMQIGSVELLFFWPNENPPGQEKAERLLAMLSESWNFRGRMWLCPIQPPEYRGGLSEWIRDRCWQLRGAVGFHHGAPTMRTSGALQGALVRMVIHAAKADLVLAHSMGGLAALRRADCTRAPVVGDFPDLEHVRVRRAAAGAADLRQRLTAMAWAWLARRAEKAATRRCAAALVCSELDRRRLSDLAPGSRIAVVANAVAERDVLPPDDDPVAVFVGILDYPPNFEAARLLCDEIWPLVRTRVPAARLLIVGAGSELLTRPDTENAGIELLGFVPDLSAVYAQARLAVAPINRGGGTRIKIIEAAAYGRPCVATATAAEGLDFRDGDSILIRDEPGAFAASCVQLLTDKGMAERLGAAAHAIASSRYARHHIIDTASRVLQDVLADSATNRVKN